MLGVNPRTGSSSFSMTLGGFLFNAGFSRHNLKLSYVGTPLPFKNNPFDIGSEWTWNIGTEQISNTEIAGHKTTNINLSDGHSFTMESKKSITGETIWMPLRHKIKDVIITGKPNDWVNKYNDWFERTYKKWL